MRIDHKKVRDGFETLRILGDDGAVRFGVGIVLPGVYDLGVHQNPETIQVIQGWLRINGTKYAAFGKPCEIRPGENVLIEATVPSAYKRT